MIYLMMSRAIEMAIEFPHANVTAVDLVPVPIQLKRIPPNCRIEVHDITAGLTRYYDSFDVLHMRLVYGGLTGRHTSRNKNPSAHTNIFSLIMDGR